MLGFVGVGVVSGGVGCRRGRVARCAVDNPGRRDALRILAGVAVGLPLEAAMGARAPPGDGVDPGLLGVAECERVMKPVYQFIDAGQWDKARTNINYCTRNLRLRKVMMDASQRLEDPLDGIEIMAELNNVFTQLDASVYTPIFIPSDEGISPEQAKYQREAFLYYEMAMDMLSAFMKLAPQEKVDSARAKAKTSKFEISVP